jgi:hypothetical protein
MFLDALDVLGPTGKPWKFDRHFSGNKRAVSNREAMNCAEKDFRHSEMWQVERTGHEISNRMF